jgi:methylthioribulose-1-phosphate dehydratase
MGNSALRRSRKNARSVIVGLLFPLYRQCRKGCNEPAPRSSLLDLLHSEHMAGDPRFLHSEAASEVEALCAAAHWCCARGWVPATSGNFSIREPGPGLGRVRITPSGIDKGALKQEDLIEVDGEGRVVAGTGKPSAETGLHLVLYRERTEARAIIHVHTVWNTLISGHYAPRGYAPIEGYEILKGLSGVTTHAHLERVPILENTQDYGLLARELAGALEELPAAHGVLLSRHGLYTWGQSMAEARRHLEVLEFLFEVEMRRLAGGAPMVPDVIGTNEARG